MKNVLNKLLDWFCDFLSIIVVILIVIDMSWLLIVPIMKLVGITSLDWFSFTHLSVLGIFAADMITVLFILIVASFVSRIKR